MKAIKDLMTHDLYTRSAYPTSGTRQASRKMYARRLMRVAFSFSFTIMSLPTTSRRVNTGKTKTHGNLLSPKCFDIAFPY